MITVGSSITFSNQIVSVFGVAERGHETYRLVTMMGVP